MGVREAAGPSWDVVLVCRFSAASETFLRWGRRKPTAAAGGSRGGLSNERTSRRSARIHRLRGQKRSERLAFHTESE
jgi:hypothetical protein